mmetsp:Transcript_7485/g.14617  ORF Transcript_7485/g.14617 Transcript_7485/m.14617 type:complete len:390 (+) Transcript_7485:132-1301(+)
MGDNKKAGIASQAEWEAQKLVKDELDRRNKMNQTILYHFDDEFELKKANKIGRPAGGGGMAGRDDASPRSPGGSPRKQQPGGQLAYDMKMKGLVFSGSWKVALGEGKWEELPGEVGILAVPHGDWDHRRKLCPVVASRQILKRGKHMYRVQIIPLERDRAIASHGQIKVGFFDSGADAKSSWDMPNMDGQAWYYRSVGNVYDGSRVAANLVAPGFEPGDVITATVNFEDRTATFSKKRVLATTERPAEAISPDFTIHGVDSNSIRFGVQFERSCPGVVLRDYEEQTADDALYRGKGFKGYGLMHIQRKEWADAIECFKRAGTWFHNAGDRVLRKQANEMLKEAQVLHDKGIGTPGSQTFDMIGSYPIQPMQAGFAVEETEMAGEEDGDD